MNVRELGISAGVSPNTITRIEADGTSNSSTLAAVQRALEAAGVIFVAENGEGPGVRLRKMRQTDGSKTVEIEIGDLVKQRDDLPPSDPKHVGEKGRVISAGRTPVSPTHICLRWPDGEECSYDQGRFVIVEKATSSKADDGLHTDELNASNDD